MVGLRGLGARSPCEWLCTEYMLTLLQGNPVALAESTRRHALSDGTLSGPTQGISF